MIIVTKSHNKWHLSKFISDPDASSNCFITFIVLKADASTLNEYGRIAGVFR